MYSNSCNYSPYVFATNVVANIVFGEYIYAMCFAGLLTTSLLFYHYSAMYSGTTPEEIQNRIWWLYVIDKIAILLVIFVGGSLVVSKAKWSLLSVAVISTFLVVLYIYYYGYLTNQYCYNPDTQVAYKWQSILHYISSIGHHLILFM